MVKKISVQSMESVSIVATRKISPCFVHPVHTTLSNGLRLMGNTSPPFFCQVPTSAGPLSMEEIFIPEYVGHGCGIKISPGLVNLVAKITMSNNFIPYFGLA